jgi:hypothetical protein
MSLPHLLGKYFQLPDIFQSFILREEYLSANKSLFTDIPVRNLLLVDTASEDTIAKI